MLEGRYRVDTEGCWIWTGNVHWTGYGRVGVQGKSWLVHRLMYTIAKGEIPEGYEVHHTCEDRLCVNPDHLYATTMVEHKQLHGDMVDTCRAGHPKVPGNWVRYGDRWRCRECNNANARKNRRRRLRF